MTVVPDFASPGRLGVVASTIVVYGVFVVAAGTLTVLVLARAWRFFARARAAQRVQDEAEARARGAADAAQLAEGHVVLSGAVETDAPGEPAIVVAIEQVGHERVAKGKYSHTWTEVSREVDARPFHLILDGGARVRVVPGKRVVLVDRLDDLQRTSQYRRVRRARLELGERVCITGVLRRERDPSAPGDGYRDAGTSLVLRRAKGETMLISTLPLAERHRSWAWFYARTAGAMILALAFLHGVVFADFHRLHAHGVEVTATVTALDRPTTHDKNGTHVSYRVTATWSDGGAYRNGSDYVSSAAWSALHVGSSVPFVVSPSRPATYEIGTAAGASLAGSVFVCGLAIFASFLFFALRLRRKAWYERKKVVDGGAGRIV